VRVEEVLISSAPILRPAVVREMPDVRDR
jgi:hypothetical protein